MRSIVQGFVVGALGLDVLIGSPAVSLAEAKQKNKSEWVSCEKGSRSVDFYCTDKRGNWYRCPSAESQKIDCTPYKPLTPGGTLCRGTACPEDPVRKPNVPGGMQMK